MQLGGRRKEKFYVSDVFARFQSFRGIFGRFFGRFGGHVWEVVAGNFERFLDSFRGGF